MQLLSGSDTTAASIDWSELDTLSQPNDKHVRLKGTGAKIVATLGAHFGISGGGKPRSYRDCKAVAIEAADYLKRKHPHSEVMVKDIASGKETAVAYRTEAAPR
jgi:hypothetical protein